MFKRVVAITFLLFGLFLLTSCDNVFKAEKSDALKFKEEYETLNNGDNGAGRNYRPLEIAEDNPFIYTTAEELVKKIDADETFLVYFGYPTCPWCRSMLPSLMQALNDNHISRIYYVNVLDIRNSLEYNDGIKTVKEGSKGYTDLLDRLGNILEDYELQDDNGTAVTTGQKRIYAPTILSVLNGEGKILKTSADTLLTDAYQELTPEINDSIYKACREVIASINTSCEIDRNC